LRLDINNPLRLGALERLASFTRVIRFDIPVSGSERTTSGRC
jgi:hypothetical protein